MLQYAMRPATAAGLAAPLLLLVRFHHVLVVAAVLALAAEAARGLLLRPTLRVTDEGIDVVVVLRRVHVPWPEVEAVRVDRQRRRLVSSTWLEIDTGDALLAVPAYRLGAPVARVAEEVSRAGPSPR